MVKLFLKIYPTIMTNTDTTIIANTDIKDKRIALIGAGNVAQHLGPELIKSGLNLCQIYSRTNKSARDFGEKTGIAYTSNIDEIYKDCDIYIFCIKDDALKDFLINLNINKEALLLHTSGSLPISIFENYSSNYGNIYPLQTFSKERELSFKNIPICIEGSSKKVENIILFIARNLSCDVRVLNFSARKKLHLAAVFACNFVNSMYSMADELLTEDDISFDILYPLIEETAKKIKTMSPIDAQTGPAVRGDKNIMSAHKDLLKNKPELRELYEIISKFINSRSIY